VSCEKEPIADEMALDATEEVVQERKPYWAYDPASF